MGNLGDTNDDDDDEFNNTQAFKFNPLGGKGRSQVSPLSAPALSTPRTTSGLAFNTPPGSALLFDPLVRPLILLVFANIHLLYRRVLPRSLTT